MLLLCLTGLPLIFGDEIDAWVNAPTVYSAIPQGTSRPSLDQLVSKSRRMYPGQIISSIAIDDTKPQTYVWMAPSFAAKKADPKVTHFIRFDSRTGRILGESKPPSARRATFMGVILQLHMDLFGGLPGRLFLAGMGLLLIAAVVSGMVLYGPFTRKVEFGAVRRARSSRVRWLDTHNLIGVVTLAWLVVVGTTGVMNELDDPLFALWQRTDVKKALAPYKGRLPLQQSELASVQRAVDVAGKALPDMTIANILFPGAEGGSPYHYLMWSHGQSHLTERLSKPILIDAGTGKLTAVVRMPWYLRALEVSRPLHFGDYGGIPLKILWVLLDLVTIVVLGSGLYLWIARPRRERTGARARVFHGASPAMEPAE